MRRQRLLPAISAVASATLWAYACGDGTTEPSPSAPDPQQPTAVAVTPATATVFEGDTLHLTATATNAHGQLVTRVEFVWASADTSVAVVDTTGLVIGVGAGQAVVTATAAGLTGRAQLTVEVHPDRAALAALYNATDGPNWLNSKNWLTDAPLGKWHGVDTDAEGRVVRVDLAGQFDDGKQEYIPHGLRGQLPFELANLTELAVLSLHANSLTGRIPPELGGLSSLEWLTLSDNDLSGAIPSELGNLANLEWLGLGGNNLTGRVPPELGDLANLETLRLERNALSGEIPPELGNLANLETLFLDENDLSGEIPPELTNLANLRDLTLESNDLSGPILPELGDLANLEWLFLGNNNLTGEIPPELGNLANLEWLGLWSNNLTGEIPPELGNLANLEWLFLENNNLTGEIPPELGDLAKLKRLFLWYNALTGEIPRSFLQLGQLRRLFVGGQDVCVPGASAFVVWFDRIKYREAKGEVFCNAADVAALESLYDLTDGANWTESGGWLGDKGVEDWYGVTADARGHVTELDLEGNGLAGRLSGALGNLPRIAVLRIADNALNDRLPLSLTALDLDEFHYDGTNLCEPADADFRRWLEGIVSRRGTGAQCAPLTERDALTALYASTGGPGWTQSNDWLSEAPLGRWHGVEVDAQSRVVRLDLSSNELSGEIPPELGKLANLRLLDLQDNALSGELPEELANLTQLTYLTLWNNDLRGSIPPELGDLANLQVLSLTWNALSGAIPPELGELANLQVLKLSRNALSGEIPPELGDLAKLEGLYLGGNALSGAIPPELGDLASLRYLDLTANDLSGPVPPTFGGLASLNELELSHNRGLAGIMPAGMRDLALESLIASGTNLCVPREPAFVEWLVTIPKRRIAVCGEPPAVYLVQTVQSRAHPVPLVAGEEALLRVFVTAAMATTEGLPDVRARFYLNGSERHVADIAASSTPIPTEINEGDLSKSANAEIPGRIVQPGLEMVVEIDPGGRLDPGLGVPGRIPEEGRLAVEVREMPALDLTVIPFLWSSDPDSAIIGLVDGMAADPHGHALLEDTRVLLPVADIDVTAHAPVASTSNNAHDLLSQTEAIRVMEGGGGHYMGMMSGSVTGPGGVAKQRGRSNFSRPGSGIIAHELGHNMSLAHAPCGAPGPDPSFPYPDGAIGAWGYDFGRAGLVPASRKDHMSYCGPTWTSDYHFANALRHRLADEGASAAARAAAAVRSLLLWGGVDTTGTPFLNPAFVVDAPPALPDSAGDYTVTGRDASGRELFSLSFAMPETADGNGSSSFAFGLPVRAGWEASLATITLSGPGGTAALDGDSDIPMAILRDPRTGQVRGILRDPPPATQAAADAVGSAPGAPGLEVLFSRGIPSAAAWRR